MKLDQVRPNVFRLTGTSHEVAALLGAARMALEVMRTDERAPREVVVTLERVLNEYDAARERLGDGDGR